MAGPSLTIAQESDLSYDLLASHRSYCLNQPTPSPKSPTPFHRGPTRQTLNPVAHYKHVSQQQAHRPLHHHPPRARHPTRPLPPLLPRSPDILNHPIRSLRRPRLLLRPPRSLHHLRSQALLPRSRKPKLLPHRRRRILLATHPLPPRRRPLTNTIRRDRKRSFKPRRLDHRERPVVHIAASRAGVLVPRGSILDNRLGHL